MPPLFDDDVVSPELALVDPELAERARAALPPRGPQRRVAAVPAPVVVSRPRRRVAAPALTLLATAAASLIVTSLTGPDQASGDPSAARELPSAPVVTADAGISGPAAEPTATTSRELAGDATSQPSVAPQQVATPTAVSAPSTAQAPSVRNETAAPTRTLAASAKTLVWPRSTHASAYDLELVRDRVAIFTTRSRSPHVVIPRTWTHGGVTHAIQAEDHVYVWPVVDGRRSAEPVVNGVLALDMTRIARLIELSQSTAHP